MIALLTKQITHIRRLNTPVDSAIRHSDRSPTRGRRSGNLLTTAPEGGRIARAPENAEALAGASARGEEENRARPKGGRSLAGLGRVCGMFAEGVTQLFFISPRPIFSAVRQRHLVAFTDSVVAGS